MNEVFQLSSSTPLLRAFSVGFPRMLRRQIAHVTSPNSQRPQIAVQPRFDGWKNARLSRDHFGEAGLARRV